MTTPVIHVIISALLSFASYTTNAQFSNDTAAPVVNTQSGKVRGQMRNNIFVFKSVPFAAPPVGNLKFAAPVKPKPWDGVRDATKSGPTAPFNVPAEADIDSKPAFHNGWIKGDDYLTANIWSPALEAKRLPVVVFIHGGAFVVGTGDVPLYDGTAFAKKGVVLVSVNYRVGIEGFLKIKDVPTNLGIRDQIAALQWVRDNISGFGGDPENVTIMGESAGGMSVGVLLVSPPAQGLFKKAIMMSGSGQAVLSGEQADRIARQYAKTLKLKNTRASYLKFSPEDLLVAQTKVKPKMVKLETKEHTDPTGGLVLFFPVIDGDVVLDIPLKQMQNSTGGKHDLLIGYNSDEVNYFLVPTGILKKIKLNLILKKAVKTVHPAPAAAIAVYKDAYPKKNLGELFSSVLTAYQFLVPSIRYADAHSKASGKTFMYEFGWPSSVANGTYGAYHGLGLPFVFNNLEIVTGDRGMLGSKGGPPDLAEKMQNAFVQFAKSGNPGWEAYNSSDRKIMFIDNTWQMQANPHAKEVTIWDGVR